MSNTILKCPPIISSITINGQVKNVDGSGEITVDSADVATAVRQSTAFQDTNSIKIGISKPPTNPTT